MSEITLSRPLAGQHVQIPANASERIVFTFPLDQPIMELSEDSSNLVIRFDDESSIELLNFYTCFTKENMPEFTVDGQILSGTDFLTAFGANLMPAAGEDEPLIKYEGRGGRFYELSKPLTLMEGIQKSSDEQGESVGVQAAESEQDNAEPSSYDMGDQSLLYTSIGEGLVSAGEASSENASFGGRGEVRPVIVQDVSVKSVDVETLLDANDSRVEELLVANHNEKIDEQNEVSSETMSLTKLSASADTQDEQVAEMAAEEEHRTDGEEVDAQAIVAPSYEDSLGNAVEDGGDKLAVAMAMTVLQNGNQ